MIDLAVFAAPATSPASLILKAELYSPPPRLPKFVDRKLARFQMIARVSPEGESPSLPATSPKLLSRQGTAPAGSSETVYAVVSPNVARQITTPAVNTRVMLITLVILILSLLSADKTVLIRRSIFLESWCWRRHQHVTGWSWHSHYSSNLNCHPRCKHEPDSDI
jgi:hypothetical protein